jgi:hypothetical protein
VFDEGSDIGSYLNEIGETSLGIVVVRIREKDEAYETAKELR